VDAISDGMMEVRSVQSIAWGAMYVEQELEISALTGGRILSNSAGHLLPRQLSGSFGGMTVTSESRRACRGPDLVRLFASVTPDPQFADDIEAGINERRATDASWTSAWER
jgi:hypothetical protein